MLEPAVVEGIEEQLTVPSRNQPHLVDLWIAIKRSSAGLDWEREFIALATRERSRHSHVAELEVLPFTERRGWIVARGVNHKAIASCDVEKLVRGIVSQANQRLAQPLLPVASTPSVKPADSWTHRVRVLVADGGMLSRAFSLSTRRSSEVDIAPNP